MTLLFQCVLISSLSHKIDGLRELTGGGGPQLLPARHCHVHTSRSGPVTAPAPAIVELADPHLTQCYLPKLNAATSG